MPTFTFRAKKGPQQIITDTIEAASLHEAIAKITQGGAVPLDVKESVVTTVKTVPMRGAAKQKLPAKAPLKAIAAFTRSMYDLLDAGVPLLKSLQIISRQKLHPSLKEAVEAGLPFVKDGGSLSGALHLRQELFGKMYINMVKSGEGTGNLPEVLNRLAEFIDKDMELRSRVSSAMLYPLIILGVGVLSVVVMLTFVLPKLMTMFEDFDAALPAPTVFVMGLSKFFASFWWLILLLGIAAVWGTKQWLQRPGSRLMVDGLLLKLPIVGEFIREAEMARFARTLGTLLDSGVPIPQALESTALVIGNVLLQEQMREVALKVKAGASLTAAVKSSQVFGELAVNFISVGEESGKVERALYKLALACERQTQETAGTFVTLLGPLMLVFIVGVVGFLVVSMLLPMFKMNMIVN